MYRERDDVVQSTIALQHSDGRDIFYWPGRRRELGFLGSIFFAGLLVKDVLKNPWTMVGHHTSNAC